MPSLEDFQKGIPLSEELAKLRAGILDEPNPPEEEKVWDLDDPERPLDDGEREDLRRLMLERGWRVLLRLRNRTCIKLEREATLVSKQDPLRNAEKIAAGWAYLGTYEKAMNSEQLMIEEEIAKLKRKASDGGDSAGILD